LFRNNVLNEENNVLNKEKLIKVINRAFC